MTQAQQQATQPHHPLPGEGVEFPAGYVPTEKETYMNEKQLAYFKGLLLDWRQQLEKELAETLEELQASSTSADLNDTATNEYEQEVELRTRDRERKLIMKIDEALGRIENNQNPDYDGDDLFGYCEETGDPIGIPRLLARPIATLSIEAKRVQEKQEKGYAG